MKICFILSWSFLGLFKINCWKLHPLTTFFKNIVLDYDPNKDDFLVL